MKTGDDVIHDGTAKRHANNSDAEGLDKVMLWFAVLARWSRINHYPKVVATPIRTFSST